MMRVGSRDLVWLAVGLVVLLVLVFATAGVTPWGLVAEAWRTLFGTVATAG